MKLSFAYRWYLIFMEEIHFLPFASDFVMIIYSFKNYLFIFICTSDLISDMFTGYVYSASKGWKRTTEPLCGCLEPNPGYLEEQQVLLTSEPPFQPQYIVFKDLFYV